MYKIKSYVKEYEEFIKNYEDSQKHIKLLVDINNSSDIEYNSQEIDLGNVHKSEKFVPKIEKIKKSNRKKKDTIF